MRQSKSETRRQAWLERKRTKARAETEHAARIERERLERDRAIQAESHRDTMQQDFLQAMQWREQIERAHEAPAVPTPPKRRRLGHGLGPISAASLALLAFQGMYSSPAADPLFCPKCGGSPCCCRDDGGRSHG